MKALVTGCAGFIGSHLVESLLTQDFEVVGIDCFTDYYPRQIKEKNLASISKSKYFQLIEKDILALNNFPKVDYVFHEAGQAGVRASWGREFGLHARNNILTTQQLLDFYRKKGIKKFVYASSSSVYGDSELQLKENMALNPLSPYGITKLAGEHLCNLYYKSYGTPVISLRYFTVYGPRQRPDMAIHKFIRAIMDERELTIFGDGEQTRDFTFIDDVVEANIVAAKSNITGEVLNIGSGSQITVNELVSKISNELGKVAKIRYSPMQKGDVAHTLADISRASEWLGWKPTVNIADGLRKYAEWVILQSNVQ
jgi:UDP-glucose 4-epimerase